MFDAPQQQAGASSSSSAMEVDGAAPQQAPKRKVVDSFFGARKGSKAAGRAKEGADNLPVSPFGKSTGNDVEMRWNAEEAAAFNEKYKNMYKDRTGFYGDRHGPELVQELTFDRERGERVLRHVTVAQRALPHMSGGEK